MFDSMKERTVDNNVLAFLKSEEDRDIYCTLLGEYFDLDSGRYRNAHVFNTILKEQYFSKTMNNIALSSVIGNFQANNFKININKLEYLIDREKNKKISKEQTKILFSQNPTRYELLYQFFIYYGFNDFVDAGVNKKLNIYEKNRDIKIKNEYDKIYR